VPRILAIFEKVRKFEGWEKIFVYEVIWLAFERLRRMQRSLFVRLRRGWRS